MKAFINISLILVLIFLLLQITSFLTSRNNVLIYLNIINICHNSDELNHEISEVVTDDVKSTILQSSNSVYTIIL